MTEFYGNYDYITIEMSRNYEIQSQNYDLKSQYDDFKKSKLWLIKSYNHKIKKSK